MRNVAVIFAKRTPFCRQFSDLKDTDAYMLGAYAAREARLALEKWNLPLTVIDRVIGSNVATPLDAPNPARSAAVFGGFPDSIPADTMGKNCGSGVAALNNAAMWIRSNMSDAVLVIGAESMSRISIAYDNNIAELLVKLQKVKGNFKKLKVFGKLIPRLLNLQKYAPRAGVMLGLTDPMCNLIMGLTAENISKDPDIGLAREDQDLYAVESHKRAFYAWEKHLFDDEVFPVVLPSGLSVVKDNGIMQDADIKKFGDDKPFFDRQHGTVTVKNSSQITDGAAAMILMEAGMARAFNLPVLGYIGAYEDFGFNPRLMGLAPVGAIAKVLRRCSEYCLSDFDLIEINEAFAAVPLGVTRVAGSDALMKKHFSAYGFSKALGEIDSDKLNVKGGAIALGHPIGVTGLRLAMTALYELRRRNANTALISACVGGGQGVAMTLRREE